MKIELIFIFSGIFIIANFIQYKIKIRKEGKKGLGFTLLFYISLFIGILCLAVGILILSR